MIADISHVGLMGTHGTGKSTYARQLWAWAQEQCPGQGVALVNEVARRCPYPVNRGTSAEAQLWIFNIQMANEIEAIGNAEYVICDRTVLDGLAYAEAADLLDVVDACMPMALMWMERYSHILWFRPQPGRLVEDGFRDVDPNFQIQIDNILKAWINLHQIPVHEVSTCCDAPSLITPVEKSQTALKSSSWPL